MRHDTGLKVAFFVVYTSMWSGWYLSVIQHDFHLVNSKKGKVYIQKKLCKLYALLPYGKLHMKLWKHHDFKDALFHIHVCNMTIL